MAMLILLVILLVIAHVIVYEDCSPCTTTYTQVYSLEPSSSSSSVQAMKVKERSIGIGFAATVDEIMDFIRFLEPSIDSEIDMAFSKVC